MGRNIGNLNFAQTFEVGAQAPFDARIVVESQDDLTNSSTYNSNAYNGMIVSVTNDNTVWMLKNMENITDIGSWVRIDAGAAGAAGNVITTDDLGDGLQMLAEKLTIKIDSTGNVSLTTSANGLKADIGATPEDITSLLAEDDKVLDTTRLASGRYAISSTLGLAYDSGTKKINLTGKSNAVIATIDATDFIKDGMVQSVELEGNNLVITFNTDAGTEPISVDLSKFLDVYTAGNGISISGKSIAAKVDPDAESFLTVGANGLKISGIHAEITSAISQALTWTEVGE